MLKNTPENENTFAYETKLNWLGKKRVIYRKTSKNDTPEIMYKLPISYRVFNFISFLIFPTIIALLILLLFF